MYLYLHLYFGPDNEAEKTIRDEMECTYYMDLFKHDDYGFGKNYNTTFYIYVFNFTTPFKIQVGGGGGGGGTVPPCL